VSALHIFCRYAVLILPLAASTPAAASAQAPVGNSAASTTAAATTAEAYYQFLLGRHLEGDGQIDKAVAAYQRAAALDPASSAIPAELAGLYARQGRIKEATSAAEAALKLNPADVDAHRVLGSVYASLADPDDAGKTPADSADNVRKAVEHLEKAHRADGTDRDAGLDLALSRLYIQSDQDQKAADLLRRVIEYEPDAGEAYVLLAHVETSLGHAERATDALEAGAAANPRLLQTLAGLYETQQNWAGAAETYERLSHFNTGSVEVKTKWAAALLQTGDDKDATKARDLLVEVNRAAPTETRPLYLLSVAERKRHDYAAAETAAKRLVALDTEGSSGSFALAQVYEDQHLYGRAADTLAPAVARLDSAGRQGTGHDLLTLLAHLGFAQLQAGRADAAIRTFSRARELAPGHSFDTSLAQAYIAAKKYDEAADIARGARLAQPDEPRYTELEARALTLAGKKDRAVTLMRDLAATRPTDVGVQLAFVQSLEDAGRRAEADGTLKKAADTFPGDVRVPFQQGALLEKRKDYAGAEAAFRSALAKDPAHAPTLNYLGYMLAEHTDRLDEAVSLVQQALKADPDNGSYMDSLGWALVQQKKYEQAEPLLKRAAAQLPSNSVVQEHLGDLLWAKGQRQDAVSAWQRALDGDREEVDVKAIEKKIAKGH
jgi:tetratricopeptide (TPR) repeat protein